MRNREEFQHNWIHPVEFRKFGNWPSSTIAFPVRGQCKSQPQNQVCEMGNRRRPRGGTPHVWICSVQKQQALIGDYSETLSARRASRSARGRGFSLLFEGSTNRDTDTSQTGHV